MSKKKSAPAPSISSSGSGDGSLLHYDPNRKFLIFLFFLIAIGGGILAMVLRPTSDVPVFGWELVAKHPHDPEAFTQGLLVDPEDGTLLESTGQFGRSSIRRVELATGKVLKKVDLDSTQFGEGIALHNGHITQLTWKNGQALRWTPSLEKLEGFSYDGDGWGLTSDGTHLIMSNGTHKIVFREPETFEEVRSILVTRAGRPVNQLNELEYVGGTIYANRLNSDLIYAIDPQSGKVRCVIDLDGLWPGNERPADGIMNGIAVRPDAGDTRVMLVTGKYCPHVYEVRIVPGTK